jgi:hypothetical protein
MMEGRSRTPVTGKFNAREGGLKPEEHHIGWSKALQNALDNIEWPIGEHQAQIAFGALVEVENPGHVIEYHVTVI